jgi:hypothetical protein
MATFSIPDNTKGIIDDLTNGTAFDDSLSGQLSTLRTDLAGIAAKKVEYSTVMGSFSPTTTQFDNVVLAVDETPLTLDDFSSLDIRDSSGVPFSAEMKQALVGLPRGMTGMFRNHVTSHFANLSDRMSLYASSQSVRNALGQSAGCGGLVENFGSILSTGKEAYAGFFAAKNDIQNVFTEVKQIKTQIQSEINTFDDKVVQILTGRVNNTILSRVVKGTGLQDQVDAILIEGGFAKDSATATQVRSEIAVFLTPTLNNFFNKKASVNSAVAKISAGRASIFDMIGRELTHANQATSLLRKLGAANAMQNLFKTNECIQTLIGFVGRDGFIGRLGTSI